MKKILRIAAALLATILAGTMFAYAQATGADAVTGGLNRLSGLVDTFTKGIVSSLATLFATMAMVAFFWGIVQFIWGIREGDATKSKNGKNFMLWGLIALFVMFSVWGIIIYIQTIFNIQNQNTITIPRINIGTSSTSNTNPNTNTGLPTGGNVDGCTVANATCTSSTGQSGHCVQGNASRDFALYCSPDSTANTQSTSQDCAGIASEAQRNACFAAQAGATQSTSQDCAGIASEAQRNACFAAQAGACSPEGSACTLNGFNGICGVDNVCHLGGSR